ncbi:MAG TPA: WD40 repeat domain-containing protein [Gemmataceae bacterium]|nr:WD40 repeat domain-containing protein [Gemmataceae bacterium]
MSDAVITAAGEGRTVYLWDAATGNLLRTIETDTWGRKALAFSTDGTVLATAGDAVSLWQVATGEQLAHLKDQESESYCALSFSPDGKMLAVGTGGHVVGSVPVPSSVLLLEVPTGRKLRRMA